MSPPARTDPPYVPIRATRWATRRTPRSVLPTAALLVAGAVLVALVQIESGASHDTGAALQQALRRLDAQRAAVYAIIESASTSLSARATPPALPG